MQLNPTRTFFLLHHDFNLENPIVNIFHGGGTNTGNNSGGRNNRALDRNWLSFDPNIPDINHYNIEMQKSMPDKADFIRHNLPDADIFVDFGCADGAMFEYLRNFYPDASMIGFDESLEMIDIARSKNPDFQFFATWESILEAHNAAKLDGKKKSVLILSSVVHEIVNYLSPDLQADFWNKVWNSGFDYIAIRDMALEKSVDSQTPNPDDVAKVRAAFKRPELLEQFEGIYGDIGSSMRQYIHFLLKYRYEENWEREVYENYVKQSLEDLLAQIPDSYKILYQERFKLPYLEGKLEQDFGVVFPANTHIKLILAKHDERAQTFEHS